MRTFICVIVIGLLYHYEFPPLEYTEFLFFMWFGVWLSFVQDGKEAHR